MKGAKGEERETKDESLHSNPDDCLIRDKNKTRERAAVAAAPKCMQIDENPMRERH
jgi:hypothetical protein